MDGIVTLAERSRRRLEAMREALPVVDNALRAYAAAHGGRFIRFGSSATGTLRTTSDIDLLADFADDHAAVEACRAADDICTRHTLVPDSRPASWASDQLRARAEAEGVVLR